MIDDQAIRQSNRKAQAMQCYHLREKQLVIFQFEIQNKQPSQLLKPCRYH